MQLVAVSLAPLLDDWYQTWSVLNEAGQGSVQRGGYGYRKPPS